MVDYCSKVDGRSRHGKRHMGFGSSSSQKRVRRRQVLIVGVVLLVVLGSAALWSTRSLEAASGGPLAQFTSDSARAAAREIGRDRLAQLIEGASTPTSPKRLKSIQILGYAGFSEALPTLEDIINNAAETDSIRGEALLAIYLIDTDRGRAYAKQYANEINHIGRVATAILTGNTKPMSPKNLLRAILEAME